MQITIKCTCIFCRSKEHPQSADSKIYVPQSIPWAHWGPHSYIHPNQYKTCRDGTGSRLSMCGITHSIAQMLLSANILESLRDFLTWSWSAPRQTRQPFSHCLNYPEGSRYTSLHTTCEFNFGQVQEDIISFLILKYPEVYLPKLTINGMTVVQSPSNHWG